MGQAKQRKDNAGVARWIEASEQERVALSVLLDGARPKGEVDQRRHNRLYKNFDVEPAGVAWERLQDETLAAGDRGKPARLSAFATELVEYETTVDTIEYFTKIIVSAEPSGALLKHLDVIRDRMEGANGYKAPSVRAAEAATAAATNGASSEDHDDEAEQTA